MRIAVTFDRNGQVFQHFGHTEMFKIYDINDENQVSSMSMLDPQGASCCALARFLKENNVDVLICGGIGENAIKNLTTLNIKVVNGVTGDSDISVAKFLAKTLNFSLEANCKHEQDKVERHQCHSHHDDCHECN
jgi:predicted Fe-Mo cluster-binding NifX family protein